MRLVQTRAKYSDERTIFAKTSYAAVRLTVLCALVAETIAWVDTTEGTDSPQERHRAPWTRSSTLAPDVITGARCRHGRDAPPTSIEMLGHRVPTTCDATEQTRRYITVRLKGRLGNRMFAHASLLGVARANRMTPCVQPGDRLSSIFELTVEPCPGFPKEDWAKYYEVKPSAYDSQTECLDVIVHDNIELIGYFQSWKYFTRIKDMISREFTFRGRIVEKAQQFINTSVQSSFGETVSRRSVTLVGVHVRRGDMLDEYNVLKGYSAANLSYIRSAMSYFYAAHSSEKVVFVVCSDDPNWCAHNVHHQGAPLVISPFLEDYEDLALLSLCDHVIVTVGTFGWWGAWLAGGNTVYYSGFPAENSPLARVFAREDFYPPNWISV